MYRFPRPLRRIGRSGPGRSTGATGHTAPGIRVARQRQVDVAPSISNQTLAHKARASGGSPLPIQLQRQWGDRLGGNLARFRVHTDGDSAAAVRASGAKAINYGDHLFFRDGAYRPETRAGQSLLGHELAHGLQSSANAAAVPASPGYDPALERQADQVGQQLSQGEAPVSLPGQGAAPSAMRGDKRIVFNGASITVSDTYVLTGPAANAAYVARFQAALDQYYNNPAFVYRGYNVQFNLTVRLAQTVTRSAGLFDWESTDWSSDTDTSIFNIEPGNGRAGGIATYTLYERSTAGTIAHEVGHYLSDRIGYFSEGYSEGIGSRLGITERHTTVDPEAVMPDGTIDIMARSQAGVVTDFSLSGILDRAIDRHENPGPEFEHEGGDFCWVAREVIPSQWRLVRHYLLTDAPAWLRRGYGRYGPGFAHYIHDKPAIKLLLRPLFRWFASKGEYRAVPTGYTAGNYAVGAPAPGFRSTRR